MSRTQLQLTMRKRYRGWRLHILVSVFVIGFIGILVPSYLFEENSRDVVSTFHSRRLLTENTTDAGFQYPPDAFSLEQRRKGAVILHVIGLIYMFVALAIVCDEFFVPSLSVIIERLKISEDVAGATFMAAGGSAPELFTSLIGVFFARNNVGIGTIVGSAVFNILFVIGMCALFSKTVLQLTWWPLFRDVTFYSIDLVVLIIFFRDGVIYWWQALILFLLYIAYVVLMKYNSQVENFVKTKILRRKTRVHNDNNLLSEKPHRSCSIPILHSGTNHFRHGVLQLMIHTIDPIAEDHIHEKAMKLHKAAHVNKASELDDNLMNDITSLNHQKGDITSDSLRNNAKADKNSNQKHMQVHTISNGHSGSVKPSIQSPENTSGVLSPSKSFNSPTPIEEERIQVTNTTTTGESLDTDDRNSPEMPDHGDEPLDLSWPPEWRKRVTYILLLPLIFPMWLTLPDPRKPEKKKWFLVTFFGSVVWIFIFSYLMVWWANQTGEAIGIPNEVMGLTILAAGTSIPDLITSVIVAKKGFGDMAVSSSVGSNIFDITVGLPIPWLLYNAAYLGRPVNVSSNGLSCSIILLFAMLVTVVLVIAASKWKMTKMLGGSMLVLYVVFVVLSVLLEINIVPCLI